MKLKLAILVIFFIALALRLFGLNWDQGQHLHPDERFLTMVSTDIKLPGTIFEYFNTATSPLNPHNYSNYQFFVYGTFPIFLTKYIAEFLHYGDYGHIHLVGRVLSALFDSLNIFLLYFLSLKIFNRKSKLVYLPSLLYAFTVLPIQLSHFFAVDTFLNFFILFTFVLLAYKRYLFAAIFFGLALACKISALYFIPIIGLFFVFDLVKTKEFIRPILTAVSCLVIAFTVFRIFQPYAFTSLLTPNPHFIDNIKSLKSYNDPNSWFPPSIQWISKTPILFPLRNIIFWGLGLPASLIFIIGTIRLLLRPKILPSSIFLSLFWIVTLVILQGLQFTPTMRYFIPIYPFFSLVVAYSFSVIRAPFLLIIFIFIHGLTGLLFLSIYSRPQSRVQASTWIYQHLPAGSNITNESWDDPLPLYLPGHDPNVYHGTMLSLYDPDSPEKWQKLDPVINSANYLIMSSNRLWGSITQVPDKYPQTSEFYKSLFSEKLNFKKLIEINSYPGLNLPFLKNCYYLGPSDFPGLKNNWFSIDTQCLYPGIYFRDDLAEEAFTVYDHPKVLIFQREN